MLLGLIGAGAKLSNSPAARGVANTYTTVIRGVPELLLILLVYYGVPTLIQDTAEAFGIEILIDVNPFVAGFLTIGFIYGAFATEVYRGAFQAVPKGQIEAAHAIAAMGPSDLLSTDRPAGPRILAHARFHPVPAHPPSPAVDPTGCAHTHIAAYLFSRGQSRDLERAGPFSAPL